MREDRCASASAGKYQHFARRPRPIVNKQSQVPTENAANSFFLLVSVPFTHRCKHAIDMSFIPVNVTNYILDRTNKY